MKIKPGVLQWAAVACFCVGLIYALGIEGGAQIGQPITDGEFITAMVLILTSIALGRLSFALEDARSAARTATARSSAHTPVTLNTRPCLSIAAAGTPERRTYDVQ